MQMYKCHPLRQLLLEKRTIVATSSNLCTYINSRQRKKNTLSVATNTITSPKRLYTSASSSESFSTLTKESNTGVSSIAKGKNMKAHNAINDEFFRVGSISLSSNTTQKPAITANAPHKGNVAKPTSMTVNTKSSNKNKMPSASSPTNSSNTVTNGINSNNNNNNAVDLLSRRVVKLVERTTQLERRVNGHDEKIALVEGQQTILEQRIGSNEEVINNLANDVAHSVQLTSNMMMTQQNMDGLIAQVEQRVMGVNDTVRNLESTVVQLKSEKNDNRTNDTIRTNRDNSTSIINNNATENYEMEEEHINTNADNDADARDVGLESVEANYTANVDEMDERYNEELSDNQRKSIITLIQVMLAEELRKLNLPKQFDENKMLEKTKSEEMKMTTVTTSIEKDDEVSSTSNEKNVEQEEVNLQNNKGFVHKPEDQSSFSSVNQSNTEEMTNLPTLSMFTKLEDNLHNLTTRLQLLEARLNQMVMEKLIVDRVSQYSLPAQQQQKQKLEQSLYIDSVGNRTNNTVNTNVNNDQISKENGNAQNTTSTSPLTSPAFSSLTSHNDKVENAINTRLHIDGQWFEELEEEEEEKQAHLDETRTNIKSNETSSLSNTHDKYNDYKYKLRVLLRNAGAFPFKDADGCTRIVSEKIVLRHVPVNWGAAEVRNLCVRCCQASNKNKHNNKNKENNIINDDEIGIVSCIVRRAPLPRLSTSHVNNKTTTSIEYNSNNNNKKERSSNNDIAKEHDDNYVNSSTGARHAEFKYRSECFDANETTSHKESSTNKETASSSESSTESTNYYTNTFANTDMGYGSDDEKYERAFEITFISAQHALNALLALNRCTLNDKHTQHQQKKASSRSNTSNMPELQRTSTGQRVLAEPVISADILEVLRHLQEKE